MMMSQPNALIPSAVVLKEQPRVYCTIFCDVKKFNNLQLFTVIFTVIICKIFKHLYVIFHMIYNKMCGAIVNILFFGNLAQNGINQ